jgi:ElaB/YqjD/DUF883 family membrane-anchored ribosome-binding protein
MTQQQLEERKAEREVFSRLRAVRKQIRKEQEGWTVDERVERGNQEMMNLMETYCREHPGYQIVQVGGAYLLKKADGTTQP